MQTLPLSERGLFVEYLLPAMSTLPQRGDEMKYEYTQCLPQLACTAQALHETALQEVLRSHSPNEALGVLLLGSCMAPAWLLQSAGMAPAECRCGSCEAAVSLSA